MIAIKPKNSLLHTCAELLDTPAARLMTLGMLHKADVKITRATSAVVRDQIIARLGKEEGDTSGKGARKLQATLTRRVHKGIERGSYFTKRTQLACEAATIVSTTAMRALIAMPNTANWQHARQIATTVNSISNTAASAALKINGALSGLHVLTHLAARTQGFCMWAFASSASALGATEQSLQGADLV